MPGACMHGLMHDNGLPLVKLNVFIQKGKIKFPEIVVIQVQKIVNQIGTLFHSFLLHFMSIGLLYPFKWYRQTTDDFKENNFFTASSGFFYGHYFTGPAK